MKMRAHKKDNPKVRKQPPSELVVTRIEEAKKKKKAPSPCKNLRPEDIDVWDDTFYD